LFQAINSAIEIRGYVSPMNILTVRSTLPDMGPGTQPLIIASEMRRRGHSVWFATSGGAYTDTVLAAGFEVSIIPELAPDKHSLFAVIRAILMLRKLIIMNRPDVIHGHNATATICAVIAGILLGRRIPAVTSVRGVEERETHQWRNKIWKLTPGILLGVCEKTRERLRGFGVSDGKIRVTYNGVDLNRFLPATSGEVGEREKLGLVGKIVVASTGTMTGPAYFDGPAKGQHNLVKAVGLLKDKHPDLAVLLIGDGPNRIKVEEAARNAGIEERVIFVGRRFDIPELLAATDIYCLASIYGEFFPNSIIEAMSMNLPWIGSDIAGLSELTADNEAGWVSPPGDVEALASNLDRLAGDPELRRKRGQRSREEVEAKLTIEKVCDRILEAYQAAGLPNHKA
jgi:glycosyltransferase involved in cell wall biosynthesis